jgi:alpha-glucoside transport system substrate-binding protein
VNRSQVEEQMTKFRMVVPFAVLALVLTACPAGGDGDGDGGGGGGASDGGGGGGTIEVTSLWGGGEATAFQAVLDAFEQESGFTVEYTSVRQDYSTVLSNRLAQGDPPDVAIIPGVGFLRSFAADDLLIPLSDLGIDEAFLQEAYAENLAETGLSVGKVGDTDYALMVKLNSKSTVWYRPDLFAEGGYEPPATYEDWIALADQIVADGGTPLALGAQDNWTLTDWFESIYIRQSGEEAYDTLFSAEGNWTDQSVKDAINTMLELLTDENVDGGKEGASATTFTDGIGLVFSPDATDYMYYEGGFVGGIAVLDVNPDLVWGETIDFFPFPPVDGSGEGTITIGGDVMGAFTDNPGVAEFMQYLASPEGAAAWIAGGTIITPFAGVEPGDYPDERTQAEAQHVADASVVRYDGADLLAAGADLGASLGVIFNDPGQLDSQLETFQAEADAAWAEQGG